MEGNDRSFIQCELDHTGYMTVEECLNKMQSKIYSRARSINKLSWIENRETHSRIKKTILDVERNFQGMRNIKNLIDKTVRVKVTRTSKDRPDTFMNTKKPYPCKEIRGSNKHMRFNTGFLYKRYTSYVARACPCPDCMKSPYQKSTHYFIVKTASHVIFDQQEAEKAVFELFYDSEERIGVKLLYGVTVLYPRRHRWETDTCYVVCSTHDDDLADRLSRLCDYSRCFESSPGNTVLVSHPHRVSKRISFGDRTNVHTFVVQDETCPVKLDRGTKIRFPYIDDDTLVKDINRILDKRVIVYDNLSKSYVLSHDLTIYRPEGVVVECDSFTLSDRERNDKMWWNVGLADTQLKTDDGDYYTFPMKMRKMGVFVKKKYFLNEKYKDKYRVYKQLHYNVSTCPGSAGAHVDSPNIGYIKSRGLAHFGGYGNYKVSGWWCISEPNDEQQHESYEIDAEMECDYIGERQEEYDSIIQGPSYKPDDWDHKLPPNVLAITPPQSTSTTTTIKDTPSTSKTATSISTPTTTTTTTAVTTSAVTATATKRKLRPMIKSRPKVIKLLERTATSAKDEASSSPSKTSSSATVTTTTTIAATISSAASTSTVTETLTDEFPEEEKSSNWDFQPEPPAPSSSLEMNVDDNQRSVDADVSAAKHSDPFTSGLALRDYLKDIEKKRAAARRAKKERSGGATGNPSLSESAESSEERREREHRSALEATMSRAVGGIHQGYADCPWAKRHNELKDVDEVDEISEFEEDKPRLQKIMNRTVRVVVRYTSKHRPDTYVFSKVPYACINQRDTMFNRYGTGFLHGSYHNEIKQECPCPGCKSTPNSTQHRTRYHFIVNTATHVVFDESEAERAEFEFHCDSDGRKSVKLLYGVTVLGSNQLRLETEYTSVVCVTHDDGLADELKRLCHDELELTMSWFLVSHPHGKRKKISVNLSPELNLGGVFIIVMNKTEMKLKKDTKIRLVGMVHGDTFVQNYIKSLLDSKILSHDGPDTYKYMLNRNVTICNPNGIIIDTGHEFFDLCEDIEKEMWFRFVPGKLTDDNGYSISNQSNGHSRLCMSVFGNIKSLLDSTDRDNLKIFIMSENDMASCPGSSGAHVDTELEHVHFGFSDILNRGLSSWTYVYNPEESKVDSQANEGGGGGMLNEYRSKLKTLVEQLYPEMRSASVKSKFENSCD